ncbi:hypothetical protein FC35_GL000143 [Limosilactobacillus coleohominis DSM 14060]|nr:hypothetical protein FC35_GL000143 [Limosilactobacillus coleohominis DSM 14060]
MEQNDIEVKETQNKDGSTSYQILMPDKEYELVSNILAKEGYTVTSYFEGLMKQLATEDVNGPIHQWLDQTIADSGEKLGVKKEKIAEAKRRIADRKKSLTIKFPRSSNLEEFFNTQGIAKI